MTAVARVEGDAALATSPSTDLATLADAGVIRADHPSEIIAKASLIAGALKDLIDGQGMSADVGGGKKHVEVSAWQACGAMLGALGGQSLHAETEWTRIMRDPDGVPVRRTYTAVVKRYHPKKDGGGLASETTFDVDGFDWEAKVFVATPDGTIVGSAEAMCSRGEGTWATRDDYAVRSMAETRAESRAYRRAIGWIVHIAGYSPTPLEEMGGRPASLPAWATTISDPQVAQLRGAIGYLLGEADPMGESIADVLKIIEEEHGQTGIPRLAFRVVARLAAYVKAAAEGTPVEQPPDEPAGDEPSESAEDPDAAPSDDHPDDAHVVPDSEPGSDHGPPAAPETEVPETGNEEPERAAPGSIPEPELTGQAVADSDLLRNAGCICPVPLAAAADERPLDAVNPDCPIEGHGITL